MKPLDCAVGRTAHSITINKAQGTIFRIVRFRSRDGLLLTRTNYMLLVLELTNQTISISSKTMEQQKILYTHKQCKLNILETCAFSFLSFPFN